MPQDTVPAPRRRGFLEALAAQAVMSFARLVTAVRPDWQGLDPGIEPGEGQQRIYYANHASNGDFILIWAVLPPRLRERTRPVAGADYWLKGRIRSWVGRDVFRAVLIQRPSNDPEAAKAQGDPIAIMSEALGEGASLIIFPEGTRNLTDAPLLEFRSGIYRLASQHPGVELVPVWIENLNRVLPKGAVIPVPLMCKVVFGAPLRLEAGEAKEAFLPRARAALLALAPSETRGGAQ